MNYLDWWHLPADSKAIVAKIHQFVGDSVGNVCEMKQHLLIYVRSELFQDETLLPL